MSKKPYINLHFNSEFSFGKSTIKIEKYFKFLNKNNIDYAVITDINNMIGFGPFRYLSKKYNIKMLFGLELWTENGNIILIAKNKTGLSSLFKIGENISHESFSNLNDIHEDENILIINHPNKPLKNIDNFFKNFFIKGNDFSKNHIAINAINALDDNDKLSLESLNQRNSIFDKVNIFEYEEFSDEIIEKTNEIAKSCYFELDNKNLLPTFKDTNNKDQLIFLKEIIKETFNQKQKEFMQFDKDVVSSRIKYELEIIQKMKIENYFLIIWDLIKWSKNNDIYIGPGRGSVAGSLIAYLLNITEINPLKYELFFERFLNPERISMPDIDIDIQDNKRDQVYKYLEEKYGKENVSQILTIQRIGSKQALKDTGRFLDFKFTDLNIISKLLNDSLNLEENYSQNKYFKDAIDSNDYKSNKNFTTMDLYKQSLLIEGLPRQTGLHAAGVILSEEELNQNVPVTKTQNGLSVELTMDNVEEWGLLKIDLLGLRTLTIIDEITKLISKTLNIDFKFPETLDNDQKIYNLLTSGNVAGIFQLESPGMISTLQKVGVNSFDDITAIISLFRPGPMANIATYANRKNKKESMPSISPEYDKVVNKTYGIIIYQEQIMQIAQNVAKMSYGQADILRKAISKKNEEEINNLKKTFIDGSQKNGLSLETSTKIYEQIEKFAQYGFNKSHAVSYATLSYKMAYLKVYFTAFFYSVIISYAATTDAINKYIVEAKGLGFSVEGPSIENIDTNTKLTGGKSIIMPFSIIKGIGTTIINKLKDEVNNNGDFKSFYNFVARCEKNGVGKATILTIIKSNALRIFGNVKTLEYNLENALNYAKIVDNNNGFSLPENELEIIEQDFEEEASNEISLLGMVYNAFLTKKYETETTLNSLKEMVEYKICLYIDFKKEMMSKFNKKVYFVDVSDSSTKVRVFFNEKEKHIFDNIEPKTIGYAKIILSKRGAMKNIYIREWNKI